MDFKGNSEGSYFETHLEFYKPIVAEKSTWKTHPLGVEIYIPKQAEEGEGDDKKKKEKQKFWPHLLKDKSLETSNTVCQRSSVLIQYCLLLFVFWLLSFASLFYLR